MAVVGCPTAGQPIEYSVIHTVYYGCTGCLKDPHGAACIIEECDGDILGIGETGQKYKCGCPE
jgi:hypothetical protein